MSETLPCGCVVEQERKPRAWLYRPEWYWGNWRRHECWSPVWLGGDEWCRRTLVIGWAFTGRLIIALRHCQGCDSCTQFPRSIWEHSGG